MDWTQTPKNEVDLSTIKFLNFEGYKPKVLVVKLQKKKITAIIKNELYQFNQSREYSLGSWLLTSLTFVAVILLVDISFYTFQTLSYTIDIYRGKIAPTKNVIAYFAFVGFFPQFAAGPTKRASHLLPQFLQRKNFNLEQAKDGLRQILWELFKKK